MFSWQEYGGISRYFFELSTRIVQSDCFTVKILAPLYVNKYFGGHGRTIVAGRYVPRISRTGGAVTYLNSPIVKFVLNRHPPAIVHETYYAPFRLAHRSTKTVITVHDMIHEKFRDSLPGADRMVRLKAQAVRRADQVICVSENTKNDLTQHIDLDSSKIAVVYHGYLKTVSDPTGRNRIVSEPYILYVGLRHYYKNFSRFLLAYGSDIRLTKDFMLVCLGGGRFSLQELCEIDRLRLPRDRVVQIDGGDDILSNLYSHASLFVFPSLYEGFGIPSLEAMAFGCPVACSNTGSLPEVAGPAAEYFCPYDVEDIISAIESVVYSTERTATLIALGFQRIKEFSWDKCAEETKRVYCSLL